MNFTKRIALALLGVMGITLAAQAAKITGWTAISTPGMNTDYVPAYWTLPSYDNQIVIPKGTMITNNVVWSNNYTYILQGATTVGNKDNSTQTGVLYIQPGTVVRGYPAAQGADTIPGGLYVLPGSKLYARGTKDVPVIFTDMWDNNVPNMVPGLVTNVANYAGGCTNPVCDPNTGVGWYCGYVGAASQGNGRKFFDRDYSVWQPVGSCWGGVILMGRTSIAGHKDGSGDISANSVAAITTPTANKLYAEGLPSSLRLYYAGADGLIDDDDSSGVFAFCQIRYNGYPLSAGTTEINGLTLYGIGRGTEINHVEIMNNADDSVEWFGGTVNTKYMVTWAYGDDGWDTDQGYRGKNQFMFAVQGACVQVINSADGLGTAGQWKPAVGSLESDKGMEMDSSDKDNNRRGLPIALSSWWNGTWIGKGPTNDVDISGDPDFQAGGFNNGTWADQAPGGVHGPENDRYGHQPLANTALMLRDGASPQIYNNIFCEFRGAGIVCDYTAYTNGGASFAYSRIDKVDGSYIHDVLTRAGYDYNYYPPVTYISGFVAGSAGAAFNGLSYNVSGDNAFNAYEYQAHIPTKQMDIAGNVFSKMGFTNSILPTSGWDLVNSAGRETSGTSNNRHETLRWNKPGDATMVYSIGNQHSGEASWSGNYVSNTPSAFPGLTSADLTPSVKTAVDRINANNTLLSDNPIGPIVRVPVSDYRYTKACRNISYIDPYPTTADTMTGAIYTNYIANDGFYTPVAYKGAFDPNAVNWMAGWTLCDKFGMVEMHREKAYNTNMWSTGTGSFSQPVSTTNAGQQIAATIGIYPAVRAVSPMAGGNYVVEGASDAGGPWTKVGTIAEDGSTKWFVDASAAGHAFFRVSRVQ